MSIENDIKQGNKALAELIARINQKTNAIKKMQAINKKAVNRIDHSLSHKMYGPPAARTASTISYNNSAGGMDMKRTFENPMNVYLSKQKQSLQNRLMQAQREYNKEAQLLKNAESLMKGNIVPNSGAKTLETNLKNQLERKFVPGNVGDINRVVWPFWFTTTKTTLLPNTAVQGNVTVTQEAAFIWVSYMATVLLEDNGNPGNFQAIDPDQPGASGKANNLDFIFIDSQSQRQFSNLPISINLAGHWKYPTVLPTPQLLLPNSNTEWNFTNNDPDATYRPYITMFGYRVRIEHAKDILSLLNA